VTLPRTTHTLDATLGACLAPRAIAVIGAGRTGGVGSSIFRNLRACYRGRLYPVNPHATSIEGVTAFTSISEVPDAVDLAVIAIPAAAVESVLDDCLRASVRGVLLITAGFAEVGRAASETALQERVRKAGLRLIGPNCVGIINTAPDICMNASLAATLPAPGGVAFASQSGALGLAMLETARELDLGISTFVSVGNGADVGFEELVEYWGHDPATTVILLYAESFRDPRRFAEVARAVAATKPIVALKSGRSPAGARAASSHTAALTQTDTRVDAMFTSAGVVRVDTLEELFAAARVLSHQPRAAGRRIGIVTNAGGPGILAADECARRGLHVAALSPGTEAALREFLPAGASLRNPVDMIATAGAAAFETAIDVVASDGGVDAVLAMFIPLTTTRTGDVAAAVARAAGRAGKPLISCFFGAPDLQTTLRAVPCFDYPELAVAALAAAASYGELAMATVPVPSPPLHGEWQSARELLSHVPGESTWLIPSLVDAVLGAAGIPLVSTTVVTSASEATAAAKIAGYPVVLKGTGPALLHKTESHAVIMGLETETALVKAFEALASRGDVSEVVLQPTVRGVEMFVGSVRDQRFGHAVACGLGGIFIELFRDSVTRLTPVSGATVDQMVDQLRGAALLRGFRGRPRLNEAAFKDIVLRVSRLVEACPDIAELDFNPVIVSEAGALVVDARIRLAPS
jgi:acetyl coenzyme A synthetase (ADP forming)-like protein